MNAKDKAFLERFPIKESSILIGLENFGATVFCIIGGLGSPPINQKMAKSPPIRVPVTKFLHPPHKNFNPS